MTHEEYLWQTMATASDSLYVAKKNKKLARKCFEEAVRQESWGTSNIKNLKDATDGYHDAILVHQYAKRQYDHAGVALRSHNNG